MSLNPKKDRPRCPTSNKKQFKSEAAAHVSANATAKANRRHGKSACVHAYRCPDCNQFHVGHTAPSMPKKVKVAKHSPKPIERPNNRISAGIAHVISRWNHIESNRAKAKRKAEMDKQMRAMKVAA